MSLRFTASAVKHGITHEQASYVIEHCGALHGGSAVANDTVKPPVTLQDGTVLTDELLAAVVREAEAGYDPATLRPSPRHAGRPPLGEEGASPRVQFRASADVYALARARARKEGRTVSSVMREFLAEYARGTGSGKRVSSDPM